MRRLGRVVMLGWLAVAFAAGCSAGTPAPGRATVDSCYTFGLRAIQRHVTVTTEPRACDGLSPAQVNLAVARAIREAVGPAPKAVARHLSDQDSSYLAQILRTVPPPAPAPVTAAAARPTRPSAGLPLRVAALAAWLFTAAAGAYLIAGWRAAGHPRRAGLVPATVLSHFGLAVAGLGIWAAFVITGVPALAWLGVSLIVLIAGLGMGALSAMLPEPGRDPATATSKPGLPVTVIAVHGMLATATILLVLLASIGAS